MREAVNEPLPDFAPTLAPDTSKPPHSAQAEGVIDGRYRLLEKLGEGGMGEVFLAEHLTLRKKVALKTIHASFEGHAEIAARFAREAMASARIEHPHVVSALDYGTLEGGGAFLVMQLARGEGMRQRLEREGALPWREACELIAQIADAAAAAHEAGIVHRDLKPENVVLSLSDSGVLQAKVLDFGIAHLRADAAGGFSTGRKPLTQAGSVMGTPGYMSPEQAVGQPVDERTDVYAIGVMLWELLVGRRPFEGQTLTEIITQQFAEAPPALPEHAQSVPRALAAFVARMLAADPDDRPKSAAEVRDRLRALTLSSAAPSATRGEGRWKDLRTGIKSAAARLRARVLSVPAARRRWAALALLLVVLTALLSLRSSAATTEQRAEQAAAPRAEQATSSARGASSQRAPVRTRVRRVFRSIFR